jgi:hypothetical protein
MSDFVNSGKTLASCDSLPFAPPHIVLPITIGQDSVQLIFMPVPNLV